MIALLTGGSGVVGGAVLRALVADGVTVRALARSAAAAERVRSLGGHPVAGDIRSHAEMAAACRDVDTVFHVAGFNEPCPTDPDVLYDVNVEGTRTVVRAAVAAGVRRIVHTSSAAVLDGAGAGAADEAAPPPDRFPSAYARSKWLAERVALAEAGPSELVVVNPSSVQGPGRATGTGKLILQVAAGRLPLLIDTTFGIVDIDDCAAGHLAAARFGKAGERYVLNGFTLSVREAVALVSQVLGRPLRVRYLPRRVAALGLPLSAIAGRLVPSVPLCPDMVRSLLTVHRYDGSRAVRELGVAYRPPAETVSRLLRWAAASGHLEAGGKLP